MGQRLDADSRTTRNTEHVDHAWRGHERMRVLGIDAALERMAEHRHIALLEAEPLAGRDSDLLLDDVDARDHLGDRMLDLQPRVRFHEIEATVLVHEKLERPRIRVLHRLGGVDHDAPHLPAELVGESHRRCFLDELLMPPLNRAFTLAQMHDRPVLIAEHLELDVSRRVDVLLEVDVADAERGFRLALSRLYRMTQLAGRPHHPHPTSAAAGRRLDDDGIADVLGDLERLLLAFDGPIAPRQDRDAGFLHDAACPRLVPHEADDLRIGTDELDVAGFAYLGEVGALGKKAVPGVDRVGAGDLGSADDRRDVQIAVGAPRRTDADVLIGKPHVERVLVGLGVDCDGLDAELATGINDAHRDLAAVRDEDLLEHHRVRIAKSRSPYCTGWPFST